MKRDAVPTISLHRAGGSSVTLGPASSGAVRLLYGSQGLGVAPTSFSTNPRVAGHGSVLRGHRLDEREVFIPVLLWGESMSELNLTRDELTSFLSPLDGRPLTLRVSSPDRERWREIPVRYSGGLQGDYGQGYHGHWQRTGLEFKAVDALWRAEPLQVSRQVAPPRKPFLSATTNFFPVELAAATISGRIEVDMVGDAPTHPVWTVTPPGDDLTIKHVETGHRFFLGGTLTETVTIDMEAGSLTSVTYPNGELWDRVSLDSRLFELDPGPNTLEFSMVNATANSMVHVTYSPRFLAGY